MDGINKQARLGFIAVSAFVIANMIGTGVFTTLGFQLIDIHNPIAVLSLWVVGGIIALCGALVYGELGAAMPRSGGEYHYLSEIYHPSVGFLSGWVSLTVGFAAPVALACMALGSYLQKVFMASSPTITALLVLVAITLIHSFTISMGGKFQTVFTFLKIVLIIFLIIAGFVVTPELQDFRPHFASFSWRELLKPEYAVSLIYVSYAYSGWNAAAYIAGDIENPKKNIPKSLLTSTILVMILYFLLNLVFLITSPIPDLTGQVEVGYIAANNIFGLSGGKVMGLLIAILLISTISSMVFVGPRVSQTMGEDNPLLKILSRKNKAGIPLPAIWLQFGISFVLIITSSFEQVLTYSGFTLNLFTLLAVLGVFVHRYRFPNAERPYKTWGYPFVPILFLSLLIWTLYYIIDKHTAESIMGFATILSGLVIYFLNLIYVKQKETKYS